MRTRRGRRGFTILELILTLVTISVAASMAIAVHFRRGEVTLENAGVLLAHDLRSVQNRSAFLREPAHVEFLADGYRTRGPEGELVRNPRTDLPFERIYSQDGVFEGVEILDVSFGPDRSLAYDAQGRCLEAGHVVLGFGTDRRTVRVQRDSGDIVIEGSTSGWVDPGF